MCKFAMLLLLAAIARPSLAEKRVTVDELEKVLTAAHGTKDLDLARQLADLQLTQRMSADLLSRVQIELPGPESRRALFAVADVAEFLDLAPAEIPTTATPDLATQKRMLALTVDYVTRTIHELPNLFTTRMTTSYQDDPWRNEATLKEDSAGHHVGAPDLGLIHPLHLIGVSSATLLYRKGREEVHDSKVNLGVAPPGLTTSGEFGPILGTLLLDAARSKLAWSHWEPGTSGQVAVFRYAVPAAASHYEVNQRFTAYQGEFSVEPSTGAILRATLKAELERTSPLLRADILVEYGPVEIGGKVYICPLRSLAISIGPEAQSQWQQARDDVRPRQTSLNDVAFEQYHVFRAEAQILTADSGHLDGTASSAVNSDLAEALPAEEDTTGAHQPEKKVGDTIALESATAGAPEVAKGASMPAATPPPETATPETSVAEGTELSEPPATSPSAPLKPFTLHVTTRLVDVTVVALDKKGRPVINLQPEDFEMYDNGRKQSVQSLSESSGATAKQEGHAPDEAAFSNRRPAMTDAKNGTKGGEGNLTVLLIDGGNLAWADLTHARSEIIRFLRGLSPNTRVALYAMKGSGFQVLEEGTVDHESVTSKLQKWIASPQDLARTQEMEARNRQSFDEVRSPSDLQYVNGNVSSTPETANPIDPQLRDSGNRSGRNALAFSILVGLARHLAATPGHKSLVWVSSDNVLVDWSDKALSSDKGGRHIDSMVMRAQEALNDAHVSVYPLDASQLETMAINANLENRNIEVSPGATTSPHAQGGGPQAGRTTSEMQQDLRPIQGSILEMAVATGGRAFARSSDMSAELNGVVRDGATTYLLSFTPDAPPDNQYHRLTVKLTNKQGVILRYRTGYLYAAEPTTLKDRFRRAISQSLDVDEIALSANLQKTAAGTKIMLTIAAGDLALKQQGERWLDKLDIFLVQRDNEVAADQIKGQTLSLALQAATYQATLGSGVPFQEFVPSIKDAAFMRVVVVDQNSGKMGSLTIPVDAFEGTR